MSLLKHYTTIAETMSLDSLKYALNDIKNAWAANPEFEAGQTEYSKKLWAQWDAYIVQHNKLVLNQLKKGLSK